ncbi:MAG: ferrous iron transport protein B [Thermodesulfobacteriota bacterium]|nr:ferrous iron transport protein B [Thermodesulfobacteriota bacterium]
MPPKIVIALAGNPNSGKTTMFNAMTGAHRHVGNYPGITVEKKEGFAQRDGYSFHIVDLPGTYSLTAYSQEELVARNFLVDERPDVVVDVLNSSALERNLYLAVQFMEIGIPVVLALNMMDEAKEQGLNINSRKLSELLKIPVVETVARSGYGVDPLLLEAGRFAGERGGEWSQLNISYGPDLDPVLKEMIKKIEAENFLTNRYPPRWLALKYLENDEEIRVVGRKTGPLAGELEDMAENVAAHLEKTLKTYPEAVIADYRYGFIASLLKQGVLSKKSGQERLVLSDNLDKVLTHRFAGPLIMLAVLFSVYQITFTVGEIPMGWVQGFFAWLGDTATALIPNGLLQSLVVSGVIDGVGGVLSFVPLIMLIFLFIAFLEDSGYMARVAYMLDRVFRAFGLHGCSVMPFIISGGIAGGCAVPGVMAARTLRSPREKLATLLTAPFMTCGAKLPVFILLIGVFFAKYQALMLFLVTVTAWVAALLTARLLRSTLIKGPSTPFVMELPPYRWPTAKGMAIHTWERTWQYIKKAGTVILAISILLWAGMTFPGPPGHVLESFEAQKEALTAQVSKATQKGQDTKHLEARQKTLAAQEAEARLRSSVAGKIGTGLETISRLAGFDWRTNIALVGGFAAKEVIISTLGTAYSLGETDPEEATGLGERLARDENWSALTAISAILFIMLYAPCFVTVVVIKQEAGSWGWAFFSMAFNTALAFAVSAAVFQTGKVFGLG